MTSHQCGDKFIGNNSLGNIQAWLDAANRAAMRGKSEFALDHSTGGEA